MNGKTGKLIDTDKTITTIKNEVKPFPIQEVHF